MSTQAEREAEVAELERRLLDPADPYDAHHGHDRSVEALEWSRVHTPLAYAAVMRKIKRGE